MSQLRLEGLRTHHVGPIDLTTGAGECVCLRGASGSGKTMLLRAVADLDPQQGETGLGTVTAITFGSRRLFDERHRLRLDRMRTPEAS